ncbi:MAG: Ribulose-phosphate 3-epimerase [Legionellaceae bacterium]
MKKKLISASILSADFSCLGEEVRKVIAAGADMIHFDVMDNHYVPNLTVGPFVCKALREAGIDAPIDVHLMVMPVDEMITAFAKAGANLISIHPEATLHLDRSIRLIQDAGCKTGIAINPGTPLSVLEPVINMLDFVLIMSVNPGFGGQTFIPYVFSKITALKEWINQLNLPIRIAVDGGVKIANIRSIAEAGADTFIAGSAIFDSYDYSMTLTAMRKQLEES